MKKIILVRYGEIVLKGLNRPYFENKLISNIKRTIKGLGETYISRAQGRIYIEPLSDDYDYDLAFEKLTKVFGIISVSPVWQIDSDIDAIKEKILEMAKPVVAKTRPIGDSAEVTFKIETKRANKRFPLKSPEISAMIGELLLENIPGLKVDVHQPQLTFWIEIRNNTYIYSDTIPANGGLPIGTNGKALLLLSGGIDSPVAGWMMAKRGVEVEAIHFYSYPYTSERAKDKVIELAKIMTDYCLKIRLHIIPFTDIQLEINDRCPSEYSTIIMRRIMMKISEIVAEKSRALALITGESMGQVASQTIEGLSVSNAAVKMPVFRPLIGMDKNEIIDIARKINTYETSILPYEDCCTVFVAKHPKTKPKLQDVEKYEAEITNIDELINEAIKNKGKCHLHKLGLIQ